MNLNIRQKKVVEATENKILCLAAAGSGKSCPNSTKIPTPKGWTTVGEVKVGDYLFDRNGNPTRVLGVYPQGEREVYEITFGDKRKAKCSIDHIWTIHKDTWRDKNDFKEYTLKQILEDRWEKIDHRGHKSHLFSIPCSNAVNYENDKRLKVNPYLFGVFLGDGCCRDQALTLSSNDEELVLRVQKILNSPRIYKNKSSYSWTFYKDLNNNSHFQTKEIMGEYEKFICCYSYEKSIPDDFKYSSIEDRYELIQGLMDTDGSITRADGRYRVNFTTTSPKLRDDFIEVMGSLGYVCNYRIDKRSDKYTHGEAYEVKINIPNAEKYKLFSLSRKKEIASECKDKKQNRKYDRTTIINIEKLDYKEEMTCFYVDNEEHLFLMNDFIVTHNTTVLTERVRHLIEKCNVPPEEICAISFTNMAADEMKKRLGNIAIGAFIGTIHSLANNTCIANGISTEKYIADTEFDMILRKALTIPKGRYPKFTHLLIDEFQDTGQLEYSFIERIPTKNFFAVADERQAIYGFKGASDIYVRNLYHDAFCKVYYLNQNYRCAPNIISYADSLIASMDKLSPKTEAIKTKDGYVSEHSTFVDALDELEWSQDWGNWFVLTRTNNELATAMTKLEERDIPYISFKKGDLDLIEMEALLKDNRVKVLTIHTAKGLENKNVIVTGARLYNEEERKIAYVAATRAEQSLYWCPSICRRGKIGRPDNRDDADAGKVFEKAAKNMISFG